MPQWDSLAAFGRELAGFEGDFTPAEIRKVTRTMGVEGQSIVDRFLRRDLGGDKAFSGWNRGGPISADIRLRSTADGSTILAPSKRGAAGVITTVTFGRNAAFGPRLVGPRLTRTGRVSKARQRRYNGRTRGKGTAMDATVEMGRRLPPIADKAVLRVTRKRFTVT
jgi:hypothetical protein